MGLRLLNANELEDLFLYGIDDKAVLGDQELDGKVLDIVRQQQTIKAVPYYEIARTIMEIRSIRGELDYIPREQVIRLLWKLIDAKPKEARDDQN